VAGNAGFKEGGGVPLAQSDQSRGSRRGERRRQTHHRRNGRIGGIGVGRESPLASDGLAVDEDLPRHWLDTKIGEMKG
jgi:hypothetical protein